MVGQWLIRFATSPVPPNSSFSDLPALIKKTQWSRPFIVKGLGIHSSPPFSGSEQNSQDMEPDAKKIQSFVPWLVPSVMVWSTVLILCWYCCHLTVKFCSSPQNLNRRRGLIHTFKAKAQAYRRYLIMSVITRLGALYMEFTHSSGDNAKVWQIWLCRYVPEDLSAFLLVSLNPPQLPRQNQNQMCLDWSDGGWLFTFRRGQAATRFLVWV